MSCSGGLRTGPAARTTVPVWVAEEDEAAPGEVLNLADLDAALGELGMGGIGVLDDELQALDAAGLHLVRAVVRAIEQAGPAAG